MIPRGYTVAYSNSEASPAWVVLQFGHVLQVFCEPGGLARACEWVNEQIRAREDDADVRGRS